MKIKLWLKLNFRPGDDNVPELPSELRFVYDHLEYNVGTAVSRIVITVSKEIADQLVGWGCNTIAGVSILKSARFYEIYEIADLRDGEIVEVFPNIGFGDEEIINSHSALKLSRACEYCDRVNATQIADFKVKLRPDIDLQLTPTSEWIVSERCMEIFRNHGCEFRPTENKDYSQLLVKQRVHTDIDRKPLKRADFACKQCRTRSIVRNFIVGVPDWVIPKPNPAPTIHNDMPVTLLGADPSTITIARADPDLISIIMSDKPMYEVGDYTDFDALYWSYKVTRAMFFANTTLIRELLEMGATGLMFRPVVLADEPINPDWTDDGKSASNLGMSNKKLIERGIVTQGE